MPRPSNREERRAQIVDGFQKALAISGYERATIAQIAREAGLTSGLIHYHFGSKLEILMALVERLGERLEQRYQSLADGAEEPAVRLAAFLDSRLALGPGANPDAVACWVAIGTEALRQPEVREVYAELVKAHHRELESIVEPLSSRPKEAATALLSAIEGCYQLAATVPELVPPGFAAETVRSMAEGLLNCKLPS